MPTIAAKSPHSRKIAVSARVVVGNIRKGGASKYKKKKATVKEEPVNKPLNSIKQEGIKQEGIKQEGKKKRQ